jgi:uncharacterized protein (DUF2236 family)
MTPVARVRHRLGAELFRRVAGPDGVRHRERIHGTPGPRWFEAGSPITRVHGDASMFVGGIRAVLLQTMHPAAMTAVAEHSGYRGDMWGRLARTSRFLAVTTFGTETHAQQAVDAVRAIHERVTGTLPDGTPYVASDPHLLLWVHVAEVQSFLLAHQVYGKHPLDQAGRDEYVAQTAVVARKLGVLDAPTTEAGLDAAVEAFRPELDATDHAREAVSFLVWHPPLPLAARPAYGVLVAAAVGLMPVWTRRPLRLPWLPVSERTVVRALGRAATGTVRWALRPPPESRLGAQAPAATSASPSAVRQ